jgi:hypothetical protein
MQTRQTLKKPGSISAPRQHLTCKHGRCALDFLQKMRVSTPLSMVNCWVGAGRLSGVAEPMVMHEVASCVDQPISKRVHWHWLTDYLGGLHTNCLSILTPFICRCDHHCTIMQTRATNGSSDGLCMHRAPTCRLWSGITGGRTCLDTTICIWCAL